MLFKNKGCNWNFFFAFWPGFYFANDFDLLYNDHDLLYNNLDILKNVSY